MNFQEKITESIRSAFASFPNVEEKKMFGKLAFMVNDKLCIAVGKENIMCRIDPSIPPDYVHLTKYETVIMKGRKMKGYVRINHEDLVANGRLNYWIALCLVYNDTINK